MKHQDPHQMPAADVIQSLDGIVSMPRRERLTRWANLLESHGGSLNALREIEYLSEGERRAYRDSNTPLTVAFGDAALREAGLASDRLGDAMDFFDMSAEDAHRLFCDCNYAGTMTGTGLAHRLRHYAEHGSGGVWNWARTILDRGN
jgi:hypothetical protein